MKEVEIKQLIKTQLERRGTGKEESPVRLITQYWNMDGTLEFEIDPQDQLRKKYIKKETD